MRATHHQSRTDHERPEDTAAGQHHWHNPRGAVLLHPCSGHFARCGRLVRADRLSGLCAAACAGDFHRLDLLGHPAKPQSRCLLHTEIQWSKKMTEITVNGMTCTSCATHVKDALEKIPGVNAAVVSYPESRAQVMADTAVSHNQLLAAIAALGYQGSIRVGDFKDEPKIRDALEGAGLHIAIIGSGGAAMAAAPKAVAEGATGPLIERGTICAGKVRSTAVLRQLCLRLTAANCWPSSRPVSMNCGTPNTKASWTAIQPSPFCTVKRVSRTTRAWSSV